MAIFGIGAFWSGNDMTETFIRDRMACVGWDEASAPTLHAIVRQLRVGDLIFIKSFNPRAGLAIKAVGIVRKAEVPSGGMKRSDLRRSGLAVEGSDSTGQDRR
jgi:hypothetical protein